MSLFFKKKRANRISSLGDEYMNLFGRCTFLSETIAIVTKVGKWRIRLHSNWAPTVIQRIKGLSGSGDPSSSKCESNCFFYRSEPAVEQPPAGSGQPRNLGPPYGLFQGRFDSSVTVGE